MSGPVFIPPGVPDDLPNAGISTCPICKRTWLVTPWADCMLPACGCYGDDASTGDRPCESCGLGHASKCLADAGSTTVALLLAAVFLFGFVGLVLVGQDFMCDVRDDTLAYCEAGR